jgi:outer membrane protein insertion porin family
VRRSGSRDTLNHHGRDLVKGTYEILMRRTWILSLVLLLQIGFYSIGICAGGEDDIRKITVLGNAKIEEGVIRGVIKSREGSPLSVEQVREDLKSIFNTGYFSDVQVDIKSSPQGKEIIFIVVEKPSIKEIYIAGNQKIKLEDIKEKISLPLRSIVNLAKVQENVEAIRKLYFSKGYYGVKIEYRVEYLDTNEAVVRFQITEGPKGRVSKIIFNGNRHIDSSDLKKVMLTKQWNLFSIITQTGILDEDVLKNDIQILGAYYIDHGFLDVKVSEPKIDLRNPKRIRIEIGIEEGPQYHIAAIDFRGENLTNRENLFKIIKIKRGEIYSNSAIRRDINALTEHFANQGYAYVEVIPETSVDSKNLIVNLTFEIDKKKRVYIEKIQISGNIKSRDKVVRREVRLAEGELYSAAKLSRSTARLRRTGYFKGVDLTTSRGSSDDKINVDLRVEEAATGALSFGMGYSNVEGVVGVVSLSDRNLLGLGYQGSLSFKLGSVTQDYRLSFTDPYFLGHPYSAGFDLYRQENSMFDTYSYTINGGDLRFGKELTETIRADLMYKLETVDVFDVALDADRAVKEARGKTTTSALSVTFSRDTRDDYFAPSRGSRNSVFIQNAGWILGGDNDFVKGSMETNWYFPAPLKTVLNLKGRFGIIHPYGGTEVPVYEKFYVGGIQTVRGFDYGKAGPVDLEDNPLGADKMVVLTSELIFPLAREIGLRGAVFFDYGKGFNQWNDMTPLRQGAGIGIRWFSPFGPLQIDIGWNLSPKSGEKGHVIDFAGGTVF